jgi:hypothetical protein
MKHYDIVIIGGGPSGVSLAIMLQKTGKSILLVERERTLGGCWRVEWQDNKYYTEHSPHIMTSKYKRFFKMCKVLGVKNTFENTYKYVNALFSIYLSKNVVGNLTFSDIIKIVSGLIISRFIENTQTIQEFSDHLSEKAKKAMYMISVTAASTPDRVLIQDLFDEMQTSPPNIQQLKKPELWIQKAEIYLKESDNVDVILNATIDSIKSVSDGSYILNNSIETRECIMALPPIAISNILKNSDKSLQNNWLPYDKFKEWAYGSYYASIGFQLHFEVDVPYSDEWCWSCAGEWNVIILPMSKYLDTFSKDKAIKTVWSCTLIDQSNYSSYLKKKISDCTTEEIGKEVIRQLGVPKPKRITFYDGLYTDEETSTYMSKDTGFVRQKYGTLPHQGKMKNMYIVSTVNRKGIITMESALQSCYEFVKKHHHGYEKILDTSNGWATLLLYILIVLCVIMFVYYRYR